jgi:hypothetical protein
MKRVSQKYAANRRGAKMSTEDKIADIGALFMEVCAAKRDEGQDPVDVAPPLAYANVQAADKAPAKTKRSKPAVQITFDLGPAGRMVGRYKDAMIQKNLLILVADEEDAANGLYLPPNTGPGEGQVLFVTLPNLDIPVPVFSVDLVFQYGGNVFCLLLIDRDDES